MTIRCGSADAKVGQDLREEVELDPTTSDGNAGEGVSV